MLRNNDNLLKLINNNTLLLNTLRQRTYQHGGYLFRIPYTQLKDSTYKMKLHKICPAHVGEVFVGYISVLVGIHRPDWHALKKNIYLCHYSYQPKLVETYDYDNSNENLQIDMIVENSSTPTLIIKDPRMEGSSYNPFYQIYIEVIPSNHIMVSPENAFPEEKKLFKRIISFKEVA